MKTALLRIPGDVLRELFEASHRSWPREACGALLGNSRGDQTRVLLAMNSRNLLSEEQARRGFRLDPLLLLRAERRAQAMGAEVLGVWHSHPRGSATLSVRDGEGCAGYRLQLLIPLPPAGPPLPRAWGSSGGEWNEVSWVTGSESEVQGRGKWGRGPGQDGP